MYFSKNKCAQYWPDGDKTVTFGTLALHLEEEKTYAYYIIRRIKMSHKKVMLSFSIKIQIRNGLFFFTLNLSIVVLNL